MAEEDGVKKALGASWLRYAAVVIVIVALAALLVRVYVGPKAGISFLIGDGSKMAAAASDIRQADLALKNLMADTGVDSLYELFSNTQAVIGPTIPETIKRQSEVCAQLLCKGKSAYLDLRPDMRSLLVSSYMYLNLDPWGKAYQFYLGPIKGPVNKVPFRSYRGASYKYDHAAYMKELETNKNCPVPEADAPAQGYPASQGQPFYMFSCGQNGKPDQLPWNGNGGDDINNWDKQNGWVEFYGGAKQ